MGKDIVVICDSQKYDCDHTLQTLTKARSLGNQCSSQVSALCVGHWEDCIADNLFLYGADKLVISRQEEQFDLPYFADVLTEIIKQIKPRLILIPATVNGKNLAAILSTRFEAGLTADCIDIDFDDQGELYFSRAAINDSVIAKIKCINCNIMMGTVKKDVFIKKQTNRDNKGLVEEFFYEGRTDKLTDAWEVLEHINKEVKIDIDINNYKKVFCVGRGIKNKETYERIVRIANKYDAIVVGTRAVVEEGFIGRERQVGQSGKSIAPHIYIGFGVSGASQHMVGIKNADLIVAVNEDKKAAIFDYSDYAIVDNISDVLDELEIMAED
ncbi:MAG: hypothetical protein K0S61_3279 [Anaerocolumna sp.]|nr:hypothetical protein [Anaerocolumna sp.]